MRNKADFDIQNFPEHIQLSISGIIDEYVTFPDFQSSEYRDLVVDLINFQSINSVGIRMWMEWFQQYHFHQISFKRCPKPFIDQVNNVKGFIPANAKIVSFYMPYFSEVSEEEAQILLVRGEHFLGGKILNFPYVLDSQNIRMDVDIIVEQYLRFLPKFTR